MAALIASSPAASNSAEFILADGQSVQLSINCVPEETPRTVAAQIQYKTSDATWTNIPGGRLSADQPVMVLTGPGTYRVAKGSSPVSFGIDKV